MAVEDELVSMTNYRVILLIPTVRKVLALGTEEYLLPRVNAPYGTRLAAYLQNSIRTIWGLQVLVLDFIPTSSNTGRCALVELLGGSNPELKAVDLDEISDSELDAKQRSYLFSAFSSTSQRGISSLGWIDAAVEWLEYETGTCISSKNEIQQYNAGGPFTLLRFGTRDGNHYWLKATGGPNTHEFSITRTLSALCGECLPRWISARPEWNAWLTLEECQSLADLPCETSQIQLLLEKIAASIAVLQIRTIGYRERLRMAGAMDQGMETLLKHSSVLFEFIEETMALQTSSRVPVLEKGRIRELHRIVDDTCRRMADLGLPETIVHGDLNRGNILICDDHCQFIDWSEAFIGNPLIMLQYLLQLNKGEAGPIGDKVNAAVCRVYRNGWAESCNTHQLDRGFAYAPLLAIVAVLYGRGKWLDSSQQSDPAWQAYSRSLARHMDRAARELTAQAVSCH